VRALFVQTLQLGLPFALWVAYRFGAKLPRVFYRPDFPCIVAAGFAGLGILRAARFAWRTLPSVQGWEANAIALAIVEGQGFSFRGDMRWLWDKRIGDPNEYFPTAWADPVYTYLLAGLHALFGDNAFAAAFAVSFACIAAILYVVYRLGVRFGGRWTGAAAVILLSAHTELYVSFFADINSTAFATCVLTVCILVAARYFEQPTTLRLAVLGAVTGVTVLTWPASVYFAYGLIAAMAFFHRANLRAAILRPVTLLVLAALVVAPWTIRNYLTFGEYVLVRTGAGELAYAATVASASTFMPDAPQTTAQVPWTSTGPIAAIREIVRDRLKRIAIERFVVEQVAASSPPGYEHFNEAQRDKLHFDRAKNFVLDYPTVAAQMAIAKMEAYVTRFGLYGLVLIGLAVAGAVLAIRDPRSWPATLVVVTYLPLFVLVTPFFDRYRSPVEPAIVILATIALGMIDARLGTAVNERTASRPRLARSSFAES
jgi:4-amino-4-deoxy-L-arabinose transferase-like glycosyltransferase